MAKRKVKRFVEWGRVWEEFDEMYARHKETCKTCGHVNDSAEWDTQQCWIEEIVEKQLRLKR